MKWIGQNIESFISRFRQKVYIESGDIEISKVSGQPTLELSGWSTTATAAHAGRIKFLKSGTAAIDTYTAGTHTTAGEVLGRIEAYGVDDGDGETLSSYIEFANDAVSDADSSPGKIVFATSDADDAGTPTVRLTIDDDGLAAFVGAISVGGNLTFDSVNLSAIQTSGESFVDNDTSIMTSAAIDDKINTKYSYAYMTWSASGVSSVDGGDPEWIFPNTGKGIYEEDWNKDENITATTVGTTTYTVTRHSAVNGLVIPHTGQCVGFHAHGRNNNNDASFKAGLFHLEGSTTGTTNNGGIDYGTTGTTNECTLRWIATADEAESSGGCLLYTSPSPRD